jgi:FKBP-type peptidyl-prolyl cis-trans isomerase SlyD
MKIAQDTVVSFHYKVATADGQPVDESNGKPLTYIQGRSQIIPGLEAKMDGRIAGDKFAAEIPPQHAYGVTDPELDLQVPLEAFPEDARPHVAPGFRFQAEHPNQPGNVVLFRVCGVQDDQVFVSGNHPLAGQTLKFDIEIADVRAATAEELAHGHIHGGAGCDNPEGECGGGACHSGEGECGGGTCHDDDHGHDHGHQHGKGGCCGGH